MKYILPLLFLLLTISTPTEARRRHQEPTPSPLPPPVTTSSLQVGAFNSSVGTIQAGFVGWKDKPLCYAPKTTFLYWENTGVSLDAIISGSQDTVIRNFAAAVCPGTIVALFHEMNGNWDSWDGTVGTNTYLKVITAYRHIHDIMGTKVQYAWVVNNSDVPDRIGNRPSNYYPGDAYVDIIGVDGFDWGNLSFKDAVAPNYGVVKNYGKPVWITSTGTNSTSKQAQWITDAVTYAKTNNIGAIIYFSYADGINFTLTTAGKAALHI